MSVCFDSSEEVLSFMGQGRAANQSPWVLGGIRKIRFSKEFRRRRKEAIVVQQLEPSIHKTMVSSSCSLGIYSLWWWSRSSSWKCFFELLEVNPVQVSLVHAEDKLTALESGEINATEWWGDLPVSFFLFPFFFSLYLAHLYCSSLSAEVSNW